MNQIINNPLVSSTLGVSHSPRPGPEMGTGMSLKDLKGELRALTESELNATSVVELRPLSKEYVGLIILKDDKMKPRCPNEPLPMSNKSLLTMVEKLSKHYGKIADTKELAFLKGGCNPPGYTQVTLLGTGLGIYFSKETGEPMGKLTGKL